MHKIYSVFIAFLLFLTIQGYSQITPIGSGSYTNNFPGTDAAGRNSYPSGTPQISGKAVGKPIPTNDWWSAAIKTNHAGNLFTYPMALKTVNGGLVVSYIPSGVFDDLEPIIVGASGLNSSKATVSDYSDWTVTLDWNDGSHNFSATSGIGMPFIYFSKSATDVAQVKVNIGNVTVSNELLIVENAHSGADFVFYAPSGSSWNQSGSIYTSTLNGKNYWSMAMLPLSATNISSVAQEYKKYAYVFPKNTTANWNYNESSSNLATTFIVTTDVKEGPDTNMLIGLLPHQWANLTPASAQPDKYSYASIRGELKTLEGNTFTVENTFYGILPTLPYLPNYSQGFSPSDLANKISQIENDGLATWTDSYNEGQVMNRLIQTARIADQMGNTEARDKMIATVKERLEDWLKAEIGEVAFLFYYNPDWTALIGYPAGHGQDGNLNDHHFHWGYFIHAAAFMEQFEPGWAAQWGDMINLLIRDAASPNRNDDKFPFLRNFSPYAGHCWANGFATFPQGNDQESTSESMQFNSSLIHWGTVTGNSEIRDLGIYLYTTEQTAIEEYWFDMYERNFAESQQYSLVSRVWGNSYDNGTFWTADIAASYGIEMYPIHGGSLYLGHDTAYVQKLWNEIKANTGILNNEENPNLWHDVMWEYLSFIDPATAIDLYNSNPDRSLKFGISDAQTYHWLHNMNVMGRVDSEITADYPIATVFNNGGVKTYVAHNYTNSEITVHFSDGFNLIVPAKQMATNLDVDVSGSISSDFAQAYANGSVNLTVDTSGTGITKVEFYDGNSLIGTKTESPYTQKASTLSLGVHNMYAKIYKNNHFNVSNIISVQVGDQIPYLGSALEIPGTFDAGFYDEFEGGKGQGISYVDVSSGNEGSFRPKEYVDAEEINGEGATVGWISAGEWLEYTINVTESGLYSFAFRYASGNASGGGPFKILVDGKDLSGNISVPSTSVTSWDVWATKTIENIPLTMGEHIFRIAFSSGEFNLGKMTFTRTGDITYSYPVASAGENIKVLIPATSATLNGTASFESNNQTLTYNWVQIFGPSIAGFSDNTIAEPQISNLEEGMYRFKLTVSNPAQRSSSDEIMVVVTSTENIVPTISISSPATNTTYKEGEEITISANAKDFDGTIHQVEFFQNNELISSDTTYPYSIQWTAPMEGDYEITAKATDNGGAVGTSQTLNVTFQPLLSCSGNSSDAQQGSFNVGYKYTFETVGNDVTITFELLDAKEGVIAYLWTESPFTEKSMNAVGNKKFSTIMSGLTVGTSIKVACKFAFSGGMAVTGYQSYMVGNDCVADIETPTDFTASVGNITPTSIELILNANDNSGTIFYDITYGATTKTITAPSGVETSYIISALNANTNYSFSVTASDNSENQASNSPVSLNAKTLVSANNACSGISGEASQGVFSVGYNYNFSTSNSTVNISFELLDKDKSDVVAFLWNTTSNFVESSMSNNNGVYTTTLTNQTTGTVLKLACKFAYAGGMSVTKSFSYTVGDDCVTNTIEDNEHSQVSIYPNPATTQLHVDNLSMGSKIRIFNINGSELINVESNSYLEKINVTNLQKGVYIIEISSERETEIRRFIKM